MTLTGERKFYYSGFRQDGLDCTALQGPCTPEGCCISVGQYAGREARKRCGRHWQAD